MMELSKIELAVLIALVGDSNISSELDKMNNSVHVEREDYNYYKVSIDNDEYIIDDLFLRMLDEYDKLR